MRAARSPYAPPPPTLPSRSTADVATPRVAPRATGSGGARSSAAGSSTLTPSLSPALRAGAEEVELGAVVEHIPDGTSATIRIFSIDGVGAEDELDPLSSSVSAGRVATPWQVRGPAGRSLGDLDLEFEVRSSGATSERRRIDPPRTRKVEVVVDAPFLGGHPALRVPESSFYTPTPAKTGAKTGAWGRAAAFEPAAVFTAELPERAQGPLVVQQGGNRLVELDLSQVDMAPGDPIRILIAAKESPAQRKIAALQKRLPRSPSRAVLATDRLAVPSARRPAASAPRPLAAPIGAFAPPGRTAPLPITPCEIPEDRITILTPVSGRVNLPDKVYDAARVPAGVREDLFGFMLDVGTGLSEAENRKLLADWRVRFELTRSRRGVRQLRVRGNREFRRRFVHFHRKAHTFGDETYAILAKGAASGVGGGVAHAAREGGGRGAVVGVLVLGSYEFYQDFVSDEKSLAEALGGFGAMAVGTVVGNAAGATAYAGAASIWLGGTLALTGGAVFFGGVVVAAGVSLFVVWALDRYGATDAVETWLTEKLDRAGWGDVRVSDLTESMKAMEAEVETLFQ